MAFYQNNFSFVLEIFLSTDRMLEKETKENEFYEKKTLTSWGWAGPSSILKFKLKLKLITASLGGSGWIGGLTKTKLMLN